MPRVMFNPCEPCCECKECATTYITNIVPYDLPDIIYLNIERLTNFTEDGNVLYQIPLRKLGSRWVNWDETGDSNLIMCGKKIWVAFQQFNVTIGSTSTTIWGITVGYRCWNELTGLLSKVVLSGHSVDPPNIQFNQLFLTPLCLDYYTFTIREDTTPPVYSCRGTCVELQEPFCCSATGTRTVSFSDSTGGYPFNLLDGISITLNPAIIVDNSNYFGEGYNGYRIIEVSPENRIAIQVSLFCKSRTPGNTLVGIVSFTQELSKVIGQFAAPSDDTYCRYIGFPFPAEPPKPPRDVYYHDVLQYYYWWPPPPPFFPWVDPCPNPIYGANIGPPNCKYMNRWNATWPSEPSYVGLPCFLGTIYGDLRKPIAGYFDMMADCRDENDFFDNSLINVDCTTAGGRLIHGEGDGDCDTPLYIENVVKLVYWNTESNPLSIYFDRPFCLTNPFGFPGWCHCSPTDCENFNNWQCADPGPPPPWAFCPLREAQQGLSFPNGASYFKCRHENDYYVGFSGSPCYTAGGTDYNHAVNIHELEFNTGYRYLAKPECNIATGTIRVTVTD